MQLVQETIPRNTAPPAAAGEGAPAVRSETDTSRVVLRLAGLTKRFDALTAVNALTLEVRAGEVVGLLALARARLPQWP